MYSSGNGEPPGQATRVVGPGSMVSPPSEVVVYVPDVWLQSALAW
jgi:hypothetical protein